MAFSLVLDYGRAVSAGERGTFDFFVSYTGVDSAWAEWIAWELEEAKLQVFVQAWDIRPGNDFVHEMHVATQKAERVMPVLSPSYLQGSAFGEAEWRTAFQGDPSGEQRRLVPVRVAECSPGGLLASRVYIDLVGAEEAEARRRLLDGVREGRRPTEQPQFPGAASRPRTERPRFPGALPAVFTVPFSPNPLFGGRDAAFAELDERLGGGDLRHVVAVVGMGGVGKTQLAAELAYRRRERYDVVHWVRGEETATLLAGVAALVEQPGLPDLPELPADATVAERANVARAWLETHARWLLIIDNVDEPDAVRPLLPRIGAGHLILTGRTAVGWGPWAGVVELDVLVPESAAAFLAERSGDPDAEAANALAQELDGLPLALEQAAGFIAETGSLTLRQYLDLYRERARELLATGRPADRTDTVSTTWSLSLERLEERAPAGLTLLELASFLAPDDVPIDLLAEHAESLPEDLAHTLSDPLSQVETVRALRRHGLIKGSPGALSMHRVLQRVIRDSLEPEEAAGLAAAAVDFLADAQPNDVQLDVSCWPLCQRLLPHILHASTTAEGLGVAAHSTVLLLDRAATYVQTMGQPHAAGRLFERAVDISERNYGPDDVMTAARLANLALVLNEIGDPAGAADRMRRALGIIEAAKGPDNLEVAVCRGNLGAVLHDLGDVAGAREQLEGALAIIEALSGPDDPDVGLYRNSLGLVLRTAGDLPAAREQLERALAITEAAYGSGHPEVGVRRGNLGIVLHDLNELPAAREENERALAITEAVYGPDHPDVGILRGHLGLVLRDMGDLAGAREQLRGALAITEAVYGPDHPRVIDFRAALEGLGEDAPDAT